MVLVQLLLPTSISDTEGTQDAMGALTDTRRELAGAFAGPMAYRRSRHGSLDRARWTEKARRWHGRDGLRR